MSLLVNPLELRREYRQVFQLVNPQQHLQALPQVVPLVSQRVFLLVNRR